MIQWEDFSRRQIIVRKTSDDLALNFTLMAQLTVSESIVGRSSEGLSEDDSTPRKIWPISMMLIIDEMIRPIVCLCTVHME